MAELLALALYMGLVLSLALYGLTVSGHFPAEHRAPSLETPVGKSVLWGTLAASIALVFATMALAAARLPLAMAVIGGGGMLLIAPLILQRFSDRFLNERAGLLVFILLALAFAILGRLLPHRGELP